jgi:drug/metabolite transporter (DMT)-like permease
MKHLIVMLGVMGVSLSPIFVRFSTAPSMVLVFYRVTFATLLLTPYVFWRHRDEVKTLKKRDWMLCILAGIFLGLHFVSYFESLRRTAIAPAAVLVNTEAIFVTIGTVLFMKAKLGKNAWFAVLLTFIGSVIVAMADAGSGGGALLGNLLALAGAIFGAVYTMLGTACRRGGVSTMVYSYFLYASAALTVLMFLAVSGTAPLGYEPVNFLTTLGMAVCCTIGGHSVYSWGLKFLPASFVASAKMMEPVFASVWALFLFGEKPGILVILGGVVVILGIVIYGRISGEEG